MSIHDDPTLAAHPRASPALRYCPTCAASLTSVADACPHDGSRLIPWDPLSDPLVGETLDGRYRVLDCLGVGDASIVYRGIQLAIDRPIAIKVLRLPDEPVSAARFLREAHILRELSHPNIVSIFDVGRTATGELYFILELLRGRTLDAELARIGRFDVERTCKIAIQLCDALTAASALGIVHRDLDPSNIMLLEEAAVRDLVKVLDFGLARLGPLARENAVLTLAGSIIGTPRYAAPESRIAGGAIDPRSDLYSLGCVVREMLAGRADPRFVFDTQQPASLRSVPADVPADVVDIISALLAQAPQHRPSAASVAKALRRWLEIDRARHACAEANTLVSAIVPVADRPTLVAAHAPVRAAPLALPPAPPVARPLRRLDRSWPHATQPSTVTAVLPAAAMQPSAVTAVLPAAAMQRATVIAPHMPQARSTPAAADTEHIELPARWLAVAAMVLVAAIAAMLIGVLWP